ncbi:NAD(P)/FAD-dependent oxidoreductase, partial [Escherichia coli]
VLIRDDDKVFPQSMKAGDVRDTLLKIALGGGASLITDCRITHIEAVSDGFRLVAANGKRYQARKIIIAAGGAAWPLTGSDGSSYRLAASLGHRVLKPRPALASVRIKDYSPF